MFRNLKGFNEVSANTNSVKRYIGRRDVHTENDFKTLFKKFIGFCEKVISQIHQDEVAALSFSQHV